MARKLIIDTAAGIGDATALLTAMLDPGLDVIAVTPTSGTNSHNVATRNALGLIELVDADRRPRVGRADALAADSVNLEACSVAPHVTLRELNGPTGLGDFNPRAPDLHHRRESGRLLVDLVRDAPNAVTLLTLGPLTNFSLACELAADFPELIRDLACLGGSMDHGGNITAAAEFNIFADPVAAQHTLASSVPKTLIPLDVSCQAVLTLNDLRRIEALPEPVHQALAQMLRYSLRAHHLKLGYEGVRLPELTALASVARPKLFACRPMSVDVETEGMLTRGMTVFDRRHLRDSRNNVEVVHRVDTSGVIDYFHEMLGT